MSGVGHFTRRMSVLAVAFAPVLALLAVLAAPARADQVSDLIAAAARHYGRGEMNAAASALEYAAQIIRDARSAALLRFLPRPLKGWTATDGAGETVGAPGFSGGSTAARDFMFRDAVVSVSIAADSMALKPAMAMLSNPALATADGGRIERIGQQPALVKYDHANRSGTITLVVGQRFLVSLSGGGVEPDVLRAYANGVDIAGLIAFN